MGCGASKFNRDDMSPTYLYYNPLHRRTDDKGGPASTNQPLIPEEADSFGSSGSNNHGRKSISICFLPAVKASEDPAHVDVRNLPPTPQQMKKAEGESGNGKVEVNSASDCDQAGAKEAVAVATKEEEEEESRGGSKEGRDDRRGTNNDRIENERKDEEEDSQLKDREDSILYPGSPSFREYCFSSNHTSTDADNSNQEGSRHGHGTDDDEGEPDVDHRRKVSIIVEPEKDDSPSAKKPDDEPARTPSDKKSKRGARRFRVGLPRNNGSPGTRSIWHVAGCSPHRTAEKAS